MGSTTEYCGQQEHIYIYIYIFIYLFIYLRFADRASQYI